MFSLSVCWLSSKLTVCTDTAGAPAVSVQTVNFDDNQHTDNENIRLGHLFAAVKTIAALLTLP